VAAVRVVFAAWLGVIVTGAALGVALGAGACVATAAGVGAGGTEATGTALWQAAMERIPAKPIATKSCCLMIMISSSRYPAATKLLKSNRESQQGRIWSLYPSNANLASGTIP